MPRTRIKFCGLTRPGDAALAAQLGVDALGLNFVSGPRMISAEQGAEILKVIPAMVATVGLVFMDARKHKNWSDAIASIGREVSGTVRFNLRQVYGLTEDALKSLRFGVDDPPLRIVNDMWFPISVADRASFKMIGTQLARLRMRPGALVLDTAVPGHLGGTGKKFDWKMLAEARDAGELEDLPPIVLAGGLNPDNVADAIRLARPYAVDVSSGIESSPGIKDPARMKAFVAAVREADGV